MSEFANWLITLMNYPVCMMITHRAHNIFLPKLAASGGMCCLIEGGSFQWEKLDCSILLV